MTNLVHVGGLTFDASDTAGGSSWICDDLQGWFGSPPVRGATDDRPVNDGAFGSVRNWRSARTVTFSGYLVGNSVEEAQNTLMDAWASIQADGAPFVLSVENDMGIRSLTVSLNGSADITPLAKFTAARVTAQFIAYDPVKYGPVQGASSGVQIDGGGLVYPLTDPAGVLSYGAGGQVGRITLTNNGTAEVFPRFVVTGNLPSGFSLTCLETGDILQYSRVVAAGSLVELDAATETVSIDGVMGGTGFLTLSNWFSVPAGATITVQFDSLSSPSVGPTMTGYIADGFW